MSRHYNLGTFLRQMPRASLESYFERKALLREVDFFDVRRNHIAPVLEALLALPQGRRAEVEADFRDVFSLADQAGTQVMMQQASIHEPTLVGRLSGMESHYERAMWLFLYRNRSEGDLFRECRLLAELGNLSFPRSKRMVGLPRMEPAHDEATCQALANGVSHWYRGQGRGERCLVEHHFRPDPGRHCFFAFAEDYSGALLTYEDGQLRRQPVRPVFEICFVFYSDVGVLELAAPGQAKDVSALQEIFCRTVLGLERRPEGKGCAAFDLSGLKNPAFSYPTDPEDGIERVELVGVELEDVTAPRYRARFEKPADSRESLLDWMSRFCQGAELPLSLVDIRQARIRLTFRGDGQSKRKPTLTFTVAGPDGTSLKDGPRDQVAKRCLRKWNIAA